MHRDHEYIQILAYRLWEARGRPEGSADRDWLEAERQVLQARGAAASPAPDTQMNTPKMKIRAGATPRAPAAPQARPTLRTSAPNTDNDHANKKQEPGWPGSS
jgi:hypothetical protein